MEVLGKAGEGAPEFASFEKELDEEPDEGNADADAKTSHRAHESS